MPSILSHPAIPLAIGLGLGPEVIPRPLLVAGVAASIVPDLDVLAPHSGAYGCEAIRHRGLTHSFAFALAIALFGALVLSPSVTGFVTSFWFLLLAAASHGILDSFTDGGSGVALLWPWASDRYFAPYRPILVSPISIARFLSPRGLRVLLSELIWVWAPCALLFLTLAAGRLETPPALFAATLWRVRTGRR